MLSATINKQAIRQKAYLFTAAKSRFIGKERTNQELYTLDMEDVDIEKSAELSVALPNIAVSTHAIEGTTKSTKSVKMSYPTDSIKADIIALTRQKGRNLKDANGVSMMDKIAFSAGESLSHTINTSADNVFLFAKHMTARKAQVVAAKTEGVSFEAIVMLDSDRDLFDTYFSRAFSDMIAELAVLVSSYVEYVPGLIPQEGSFTLTAGFPGSVGGSVSSNVEQYLLFHVIAQYYSMCGMIEESKVNKADAFGYIVTVKNLLSAQADSSALLKNIITDAAAKVQQALYPISRKAFGELTMYSYTEPDVTAIPETVGTLDFSFELKELPISSSAIQLIYNLCRLVIVNGALAKWYTMASIADDRNEAKTEMNAALDSLSFIIEDRLRFVGLFDQLFDEASAKVSEQMLAYTKNMEVDFIATVGEEVSFNFENADWENSASTSFLNILTEIVKDSIYRYILMEWWRLSGNPEREADAQRFAESIKSIGNAMVRRHQPIAIKPTWS